MILGFRLPVSKGGLPQCEKPVALTAGRKFSEPAKMVLDSRYWLVDEATERCRAKPGCSNAAHRDIRHTAANEYYLLYPGVSCDQSQKSVYGLFLAFPSSAKRKQFIGGNLDALLSGQDNFPGFAIPHARHESLPPRTYLACTNSSGYSRPA